MSGKHSRPVPAVRAIGWAALAIGLAVSPWIHSIPPAILAIPLLASILVLGLPHGALDHRTAAIVWPMEQARPQILFFASYLGLAGSYLLLWFIHPPLAFALFLILTVFHWGQGDIEFERRRNRRSDLSDHRILMTVLRGGAPVILPILFWPTVVESVAGWTIHLFSSSPPVAGVASPTIAAMPRAALGALFALVVLRAVMIDLRAAHQASGPRKTAARTSLAETLGLLLFFSVVHPLLAIALYFPLWHGLRHLDGLRVDLSPDGDPLSWPHLFLASLPLTLVSIAIMAGIGLLLAGQWNIPSIAGLYLVLLAILTLPHAVVVGARDHFGPEAIRASRSFQPETQNHKSHA